MAKELIGDACAYVKAPNAEKASYPRIGSVFRDSGDGRLSIKLDTLPLPGSPWTGWINVFPREATEKPNPKPSHPAFDDDIPF